MAERETPKPDFESQLERDSRFDQRTVDALKGPAIWEARDGHRMELTGFLGVYEGKPYFEAQSGKDNRFPVPLEEVRFSRERQKQIDEAGVDVEALLKPVDYSESPHEYERVYHSLPRRQRRQVVEAAYDEATDLAARAEDLYREEELAKARAKIERSEAYGAKWSRRDIGEAERDAISKLKPSAPKKYIERAEAEAKRPAKLRESLEDALRYEEDDQRAVLREESLRWVDFLERQRPGEDVRTRTDEAVEHAREVEQAFAESNHSPELKQEMREKQFEVIEQRAKELGDGQVTAASLEAAREWMLELVKKGSPDQFEETSLHEAVNYTLSRMEAWKNGLFKGKRKWLTAAAVALGVAVPPLGLFVLGTGIQVAALVEGTRAVLEAAPNLTDKGYELIRRHAAERNVRRQLGLA